MVDATNSLRNRGRCTAGIAGKMKITVLQDQRHMVYYKTNVCEHSAANPARYGAGRAAGDRGERAVNRKLTRLMEPNIRPIMICLVLFVALAIPFSPTLAVVEAALTVILYVVLQRSAVRRKRNLMQYIDTMTGTMDSASRATLLDAPLPMVVFRADSQEIVWCNEAFLTACGREDGLYDVRMGELLPEFSCQWVLDGEKESPGHVKMADRVYRVFGSVNRLAGKNVGENLLATTYWVDVTESDAIVGDYQATRPVVAVLVIDNYEELMKAGGEAAKSAVLAQIDERLNNWVSGKHGLLRKYDRDHYLFVCEAQYFERMVEEKFSILDTVHEVVSEDGVTATLSIGMGKDGGSFEELFETASKCIEMALSRGGDQAVVKDSLDFQFYGGRRQSTEKRTKVKSRVMAKALSDLISDASEVYVMGHEFADMDAVGAAAGVFCIARQSKKRVQIVVDLDNNNANPLLRRLRELPEYEDAFISGSDAFIHAQPGALLVVVDTNRPDMVESQQLLDSCNRVAVIDHHRRAATYIESAALNFHEPYASSASELVTELLQYLVDPSKVLKGEAEALMAGIVLDTKNFTMRTGGRTFEAAAFLRRCGADPAEVSRLFKSDLKSMVERYDIIRQATMYHGDIAVAAVKQECARIVAAKACDDLLTLQGVQASIVLYSMNGGVGMSARSMGDINVQVIMEALGGGGNSTTAGGYIPEGDVEETYRKLLRAIDKYFED